MDLATPKFLRTLVSGGEWEYYNISNIIKETILPNIYTAFFTP